MTTIQEITDHLMKAEYVKVGEYSFRKPMRRIECSDGFSISVQAGSGNYCNPRSDFGPWITVELGYPSQKDDLIMHYAEDREQPTSTVYGYVPIQIVANLITKHGGIK